jgi:hypothetical protein
MKELNEKGISYPRRYKNDKDDPSIVFNREIIFGIAYGRYSQAGRQIMDFPPGLCEMLANTDIGDVPVGEIKLPYVCQYLHFGTQQHLELDRGWLVDGAYIESRGGPGELKIVLTGKPINQTDLDLWYLNAEPCYAQSFRQQHSTISLDTALKTVLNDRLAEFFEKEDRAQGGGLVTKANEILAEKGLDASHVVDIGARTAQHEIDETNRRYPVFLEALKLIINGLLYITAYPEDIETTWPESAPLAVREKALHGNAKERDKAKSKLMEMGYSPVHICGRSLKFPHQASLAATTGEGHKSLHWRRGHWRNQPFGVGRTEHRLRWIMPMLVGTKNSPGDDPELGHIYTVKSN